MANLIITSKGYNIILFIVFFLILFGCICKNPLDNTCQKCKNTGMITVNCTKCSGKGTIWWGWKECPECHGTGYIKMKCPNCSK